MYCHPSHCILAWSFLRHRIEQAWMKKRSTDSSITSIVPPSNPGECCGPQARAFVEVTSEHILPEARIKNLLWTLVRLQAKENLKVSGWTGFNIFVRNKVEVSQDVIRYLPTIDTPATDMAMVQKVLVKSLKTKTPSSSRTSLLSLTKYYTQRQQQQWSLLW